MADRLRMPQVFLRASGSWKGNALELYQKDYLPEEQKGFAHVLGSLLSPYRFSYLSHHTIANYVFGALSRPLTQHYLCQTPSTI